MIEKKPEQKKPDQKQETRPGPDRRLAFMVPGSEIPIDDPEALHLFACRLVNHVRDKAGLPPRYDEETGKPLEGFED